MTIDRSGALGPWLTGWRLTAAVRSRRHPVAGQTNARCVCAENLDGTLSAYERRVRPQPPIVEVVDESAPVVVVVDESVTVVVVESTGTPCAVALMASMASST